MRAPLFAMLAVIACANAACGQASQEVSHPFYVQHLPDSEQRALYRCPAGPDGGCAIDGLPGPDLVAAGADAAHVVVARRFEGRLEYFYFARVPEEAGAYGLNPERIVGPLDEAAFKAANTRLGLPEFTIDDR